MAREHAAAVERIERTAEVAQKVARAMEEAAPERPPELEVPMPEAELSSLDVPPTADSLQRLAATRAFEANAAAFEAATGTRETTLDLVI